MNDPIIEFRKVSKRFGNKQVLNGVNLEVERGKITAIIGKSGTGKSVLLKHTIGLLAPDSGEIYYEGKPFKEFTTSERKALKARFSYMFQNNALFDSMPIYDNIALPLREKTQMSEAAIQEEVNKTITLLELESVASDYPSQLSGGMQKRVALARALITKPEIILFDEPTAGLDPIRKNAVLNMIVEHQRKLGFTALIVSHDIPDVFFICDRVAILDEGDILFAGSPLTLEQSENPLVESFLNGPENLKDELIGLQPRKALINRFKKLSEEERKNTKHSVVQIVIENLEEINQRIGEIAAQRVVQTLSCSLHRQVGENDFLCRYSKSKIVVLMQNTDEKKAKEFCSRLGSALKGHTVFKPKQYKDKEIEFAIKAGVAEDDAETGLRDLLGRAFENQNIIARLTCKEKEVAA